MTIVHRLLLPYSSTICEENKGYLTGGLIGYLAGVG